MSRLLQPRCVLYTDICRQTSWTFDSVSNDILFLLCLFPKQSLTLIRTTQEREETFTSGKTTDLYPFCMYFLKSTTRTIFYSALTPFYRPRRSSQYQRSSSRRTRAGLDHGTARSTSDKSFPFPTTTFSTIDARFLFTRRTPAPRPHP
jgi:hypothetical protein